MLVDWNLTGSVNPCQKDIILCEFLNFSVHFAFLNHTSEHPRFFSRLVPS